MATLPANSTFLPVLDDLLSPDFRPSALSAQTPQTPADAKNLLFSSFKPPNKVKPSLPPKKTQFQTKEPEVAAKKIQTWWKRNASNPKQRSNSVDLSAERAKHSIRHNRTEDHVRYLEAEVNRLKGALTNERKLRSLQLEAIRSLWTQMQTISNGSSDTSLMTQSMPNGLPMNKSVIVEPQSSNIMSQSLICTSGTEKTNPCSCAVEINSLKDSLTSEITQVRTMIEQLRMKADIDEDSRRTDPEEDEEEKPCSSASSCASSQKKRPVTLNLTSKGSKQPSGKSKEEGMAQKPVTGYANKMAAKLVGDAVEKEGVKK